MVAKGKIEKFLTFFYSIISSFLRADHWFNIPLKYRISALDDYLIGQNPASEIWPVCALNVNRIQTARKRVPGLSNARMPSVAVPVRGREWTRQRS